MTTVTITDEPTRRIIESILWCDAGVELGGEVLENDLTDLADSAIGHTMSGSHADNRDTVERAIEYLTRTAKLADSLKVGTTVLLPVALDSVRHLADGIVASVENDYGDGGLWNQPSEVRRIADREP